MAKTKTAAEKAELKETRRVAALMTEAREAAETIELEPEDLKGLEAEEKLAIFHNKFGGEDYKIRVEKFNKEENEWEMVVNLKLAGFDSFDSLKKYGAGKYRMSLLDTGGHYVAGGRMEARIASAAIEAEKSAAPAAPADNGMTAIMSMLQAQNAQNVELLKAMIGRPAPAETKGTSLPELVSVMTGLRGLVPKDEGGMGGIEGALKLMKLMKELQPESSGGEEGGVMDEVAKAVELFTKVQPLIEAKRQARVVATPTPTTARLPTPIVSGGAILTPTPEPTPEAGVEEDHMKPIIDKARSYVPQLVSWASRGKNVEDAADFVLDELDAEIVPLLVANFKPGGMTLSADFVFNELIKRGQDPAQVEAIFTHAPELAPYKEWFTRVIAKAVEFATTQDEAPAPEGGNHAETA